MRCLASLGSLILLRGLRGSNVNKEHTGHMKEFSGFAVALPQNIYSRRIEFQSHSIVVIPGDTLEAS